MSYTSLVHLAPGSFGVPNHDWMTQYAAAATPRAPYEWDSKSKISWKFSSSFQLQWGSLRSTQINPDWIFLNKASITQVVTVGARREKRNVTIVDMIKKK